MFKLYNIAVSFSIFTLQALSAIKPFSEPCRAAFDDFETFDEGILGDDCNSVDENIIDLGLRSGNFTQDFIDKVSTYESLKTLYLIRFEFVSEDVNLESLHLSEIKFNALSGSKKNRYLGVLFPERILETIKNVDTITLYGFHITQETLNALSSLNNVKNIILQDGGIDNELDFTVFNKNKNLVSLELGIYSTEPPLEISESICKIKKLKQLGIQYSTISSIPSCISNLKNLQVLSIEGVDLKTFPKAITKMTSLKELSLNYNQLTEIPSNIENLSKLEKLDLGLNNIKKIPSSLCELTKLKQLILNDNDSISKIPSCFEDLSKLQHLALSFNNFTSIPSTLFTLKKLEVLDLGANNIKTIPSNIKKLTKLKELYLNSNVITKIPDVIGDLSNLEQLDLFGNEITNLPQSLGKLTKLNFLDLSYNKITGTIPESLNNIENLETFYISNNVSIKGRTLTNSKLDKCTYTITDEFCLDPNSKCKPYYNEIQPC